MADKNNNGINWGGVLGGAASTAINWIGQNEREQRAVKNQEHLMDIQQQNQMELNKQGQQIQMENWENTNYAAQMEQIKKAGLSAGLIYGQGGAGGATTGSQGGGSAAGGNAPAPQPMDIQNLMLGAQLELTKAQAKKTEAEADNIKGAEGTIGEATIRKIKQETQTLYMQNNLYGYDAARKELENRMLIHEIQALESNKEEWVKSKVAEYQMKAVEVQAKKMNIALDQEKIKQIQHKIWQDWVNAGSGVLASASFITNILKNLTKGKLNNKDVFKTNHKGETTHTRTEYN